MEAVLITKRKKNTTKFGGYRIVSRPAIKYIIIDGKVSSREHLGVC